jgi:membrane-associated phospholipid phosphatase
MRHLSLAFFLILTLFLGSTTRAESVGYHVEHTFTDGFDTTGLIILVTGAAATAVAFNNDQAMHDAWVNHQRMSPEAAQFGNFWGSGVPEASIALLELIFNTNMGVADTESLISSTLVADGLKIATSRSRPDSTTETSFPSGHTQISFASGTHLMGAYGWKLGMPALGLAVFTGLSRLADDAHWLSDVVAGATIGIIFGRAPLAHHMHMSSMTINDGGRGGGLVATWEF